MADEVKNEAQEQPQAQPTEAKETKTPTIEELQAEIANLKAQSDKQKKSVSEACADAAEWKRKYRATLDEAERAKQEQADRYADMENQLKGYKDRERTNSYFAKLIDAGYSAETAKSMAESLPEGVADTFFEQQKLFLSTKTQEIKTQTLNAQPNLPTGSTLTSNDIQSQEDKALRAMFGL